MTKSKTPQLSGQGFLNQESDKFCNAPILTETTNICQSQKPESVSDRANSIWRSPNRNQAIISLSDDELEAISGLLVVSEGDA